MDFIAAVLSNGFVTFRSMRLCRIILLTIIPAGVMIKNSVALLEMSAGGLFSLADYEGRHPGRGAAKLPGRL